MNIYPELARQQPIYLTQPLPQYFNSNYQIQPNQIDQIMSLYYF
jgi:hypothetical protein